MKASKSVSLKNATINLEDMTITEVNKDNVSEYNLMNILADWNGIEGISLKIYYDVNVPTDE